MPTKPAKKSLGKRPQGILQFFPKGLTPRPGQTATLEALEAGWAAHEVFSVDMPVGAGKSAVAMTVARWASAVHSQRSIITVPNNLLLAQYRKDYPRLATLGTKESYPCHSGTAENPMTCAARAAAMGSCCPIREGVRCGYTAANRLIRAVPFGIVNNHTRLAHRLYPAVLIADEAHNLLPMLRDLAARTLWRRDYQWPSGLRTYADLLGWAQEAAAESPGDAKLATLLADLLRADNAFLVERADRAYRGVLQEALRLLPIDTSRSPPLLWPPGQVRKVVLLSATLGAHDVTQLGLGGRRVLRIATPSPIPPRQRPVVVLRPGLDASADMGEGALLLLASTIGALADRHVERGLVHVTYGLMERLRPLLEVRLAGRLMWHTKSNKRQRYQEFLDAGPAAVLLCAGLSEGVDLPGDLGRWQVITKVLWPNLGEPAYQWMSATRPEEYGWEALKTVMQASGRICRGPTDTGTTYCLDRSFDRLPLHLAPDWFIESLTAGEEQ